MNAIKDTVSEKLSRLFSDSPSKSSDQQPPDQVLFLSFSILIFLYKSPYILYVYVVMRLRSLPLICF